MPSRRNTIQVGGSAVIASLAGCLDRFRTSSVRELYLLMENNGDSTQRFRYSLETDAGKLDWESHTIASDSSELVTVEPPADATLVAFHGEIDGTEHTYEFDNLGGARDEVCPTIYFHYRLHPQYTVYVNRGTDLSCYEDIG